MVNPFFCKETTSDYKSIEDFNGKKKYDKRLKRHAEGGNNFLKTFAF